jgi:hypothetical protein
MGSGGHDSSDRSVVHHGADLSLAAPRINLGMGKPCCGDEKNQCLWFHEIASYLLGNFIS